MLRHVDDVIFPFEVHRSPRTKQCRPLLSNRCCLWLQTARMCPTRSITMHCGLSAGKQRNPRTQEPGNEASCNRYCMERKALGKKKKLVADSTKLAHRLQTHIISIDPHHAKFAILNCSYHACLCQHNVEPCHNVFFLISGQLKEPFHIDI